MKIGLVTVTFNSAEVFPEFLESVSNQTYKDIVLYVIDNDSNDKTLKKLEGFKGCELQIIANAENVGIAAGNNQGIKAALHDGCEFIMLLNNDTVFEPALIGKLLKAQKKYKTSLVAPKMLYHNSGNRIWYAGGGFSRKKGWLNYHRGQEELDKGQYDKNEIVEYAPTCCTLIHKSVFEDVGLMDEKYFVYFDDTDFFYRIVQDGRHKMMYIYNVHFEHKIGSLTKSRTEGEKKKFGDFFIKQWVCNKIYYFRKQKTLSSKLNIILFCFSIQFHFFFSGKYYLNLKTFALIQKSILKGLFL